jgi:transcriptional regulator with XRE-family HTH domain
VSETTFAREIYRLRKEMKLSLRAIARITGIAASTISRIENGRLSPTLDIAAKLAMALNLEAPTASPNPARTRSDVALDPAGDQTSHEPPAQVVTYRRLGHTVLRGGRRRDLSRIAARNGYEIAILIRGTLQLRTNDGFKENLKPGATIDCKAISKHTFFGIAAEEAELLWIG